MVIYTEKYARSEVLLSLSSAISVIGVSVYERTRNPGNEGVNADGSLSVIAVNNQL